MVASHDILNDKNQIVTKIIFLPERALACWHTDDVQPAVGCSAQGSRSGFYSLAAVGTEACI
jgi:hypothetical protein